MSNSISPVASLVPVFAGTASQSNKPVVAQAELSQAQPASVPQAPAVKAPPLVDPDKVRANLQEAVQRLNEQVEKNGRGLNFAIDDKLNRPVITVRSTQSGEIVRQIPNEVVIKVAHNIEDVKGLLADGLF